jgi:hypothetical protein
MTIMNLIRAAAERLRGARREDDAKWIQRFEPQLPYALPIW